MKDRVDAALDDWSWLLPQLDFSPLGVLARLRRVRTHLDQQLETTYAKYGLNGPSFHVLITLRRREAPYSMTQRSLMTELGLTSGTISVRIDRLVESGLVRRTPHPTDKRGALVELTAQGLEAVDSCVPDTLDHEDRLLSALGPQERDALADLLRKLMLSFEGGATAESAGLLGMTLASAHVAREMRRDVGLGERTGLLVRAVREDGPAANAGLSPGDLLVSVGGRDLRSLAALAEATAHADGPLQLGVLRGLDERTVELTIAPDNPTATRGEAASGAAAPSAVTSGAAARVRG